MGASNHQWEKHVEWEQVPSTGMYSGRHGGEMDLKWERMKLKVKKFSRQEVTSTYIQMAAVEME